MRDLRNKKSFKTVSNKTLRKNAFHQFESSAGQKIPQLSTAFC